MHSIRVELTGSVHVKFREGASPQLAKSTDGLKRVDEESGAATDWVEFELDNLKGADDAAPAEHLLQEVVDRLGEDNIAYVEPDFDVFFLPPGQEAEKSSADDNPPLSEPELWHLEAVGLSASTMSEVGGAGITVAHIDTGVVHPVIEALGIADERLMWAASRNFWLSRRGQHPADDPMRTGAAAAIQPGHGTGTVCLMGAAHADYQGTSPQCRVLPIRVGPSVVHVRSGALARGIEHAIRQQVDIIMLCMGGLPSQRWADAVNKAYEAGIIFCAAAGNNYPLPGGGRTPTRVVFPAAFERVIAVSGITREGQRYRFDDRMSGNDGPQVDIAAPSPDIPFVEALDTAGSRIYRLGGGTSAATSQIAGIAARWLQKNADLPRSWERVEAFRDALYRSADSIGSGYYLADEALGWRRNDHFGAGRVNVPRLLDTAPRLQMLQEADEADIQTPLLQILGVRSPEKVATSDYLAGLKNVWSWWDMHTAKRRVARAERADRQKTLAGHSPHFISTYERSKAIYGTDSRAENAADGDHARQAAAVCVVVRRDKLIKSSDGSGYRLDTQTLREFRNLCPGERFAEQPVAGLGTGFLVKPSVIATAGHVAKSAAFLKELAFIFSFEFRNGQAKTTFTEEELFFASGFVKNSGDAEVFELSGYRDYALVRLDRAVPGRAPLAVSAAEPKPLDEVYMIGHPVGLPKKIARSAQIRGDILSTHFFTNLDAFGGNSGSPIFNSQHEVCGILIRGKADFEPLPGSTCQVASTYSATEGGEAGCRSAVWAQHIPTKGLIDSEDISSPPPPPPATDGQSTSPPPTNETIMLTPEAKGELTTLLLDMFSIAQLKMLLSTSSLLNKTQDDIRFNAARRTVFSDFVESASQHKLINQEFMELLIQERANWESDIRAIFAQPSSPPEAPAQATLPPRQVHDVLMQFADTKWADLVDYELPEDARRAILGRDGRDPKVRALVRYYRSAGQDLNDLVEMMRRTVPGSI